MNTKGTVTLVLDPKSKEEKKFLKVRVYFGSRSRTYSTPCKTKLTKEEFANPRLKITKDACEEAEGAVNIAHEIVDKLGNGFTFSRFHAEYKRLLYGRRDFSKFSVVTSEYFAEKKIRNKTISSYNTASEWLEKYKHDVRINEIDAQFINDFISYMKQDGKRSEDTIRLYLRSFRAIYQFAVEKGYVEGENPFSHIEGQTLASTRRKNASLTEDELNKILSYEPKNNIQAFGKDFFILSLQLSGANIGDILRLRNSNVKGETVQFVRTKAQKTAITTIVPLTTQARALLEKYGKINPELQDELILPYLHGCDSDKKIDERIHGILRKINRGIAQICQVIGIRKITTNYARHTYASLAMSSGMTAEQIQKFLGHASSRTTQIYLDSLNKEVIEKNRELLENMK